jgi:N-acetylglucosamine malate deacetylase 1
MKLDFSHERVLAVVAHPDDAELLCAGTLARARADGAAIGVCVCCRGNNGQPPKPIPNLAAIRSREMAAAARLLGAELYAMGISDAGLSDVPPIRQKVIEVLRRFRPTLILAHAPGDYHPDHRAAAALAEAASWFCASGGYKTRSASLPTQPALWWMDTLNMSGFEPEFFVDVSPYLQLKERMLACHVSQLARAKDQSFSPLLDVMRRQCQARGAQAGANAAEAFRTHQAFKRARAW